MTSKKCSKLKWKSEWFHCQVKKQKTKKTGGYLNLPKHFCHWVCLAVESGIFYHNKLIAHTAMSPSHPGVLHDPLILPGLSTSSPLPGS